MRIKIFSPPEPGKYVVKSSRGLTWMIVSDRWKEPVGKRSYVVTGKELPGTAYDFEGKEYAYWMLAGRIEDEFGDTPATVSEIYHQVTGPLGLTSSDTVKLVRGARSRGYLR